MNAFDHFSPQTGLIESKLDEKFPTKLYGWSFEEKKRGKTYKGGTFFGFVQTGEARLVCKSGVFLLKKGMYFSVSERFTIRGKNTSGIIIERIGYDGMFSIGGPVEEKGRLRYIDGCTDSLLIPPVMLGDPCLNLLHFPPNIDQTEHTHPSVRVGIVSRGSGECIALQANGEREHIPLREGMLFAIRPDGIHKFKTFSEEAMTVIAYHPDSDVGPTHEDHPMINRTIVEGVPASKIEAIRTTEEQFNA